MLRQKLQGKGSRRNLALATLLFPGIGVLDHLTGVSLRLFPLYFIPVALLALSGSLHMALAGALAATLVWAASNAEILSRGSTMRAPSRLRRASSWIDRRGARRR